MPSGEEFDLAPPSPELLRAMFDEAVPIHTRANIKLTGPSFFDSWNSDLQRQSIPSVVGDHHVAATAEHKKRQVLFARERDGLLNIARACSSHKKPRVASNSECGQGCQWHVLLNFHKSQSIYT